MTQTLEKHLVKVESGVNSNKFYRLTLLPDGTVVKNWGRVGASGQTKRESGGQSNFDRTLREKLGRGYVEVDVVTPSAVVAPSTLGLKAAAAKSLVSTPGDPVLADLVDRLVKANKHDLLKSTGGMISVDVSGQVTTPMGIVSKATIASARDVLTRAAAASGMRRAQLTEDYLRLIPHKIPISAGAGWANTWLDTQTSLRAQLDLLDALDASVAYADTARRKAEAQAAAALSGDVPDDLFRYTVALLEPSPEYDRVAALFESTKSPGHRAAAALRLRRIYTLTDSPAQAEVYQKTASKLRNIKERFHGSRAANTLSILQRGLFVPPRNGSITTVGRMFGDGIYGSSQSTKAANYSLGGMWSSGRDEVAFLFLADFAMGAEYRPAGRYDAVQARTGSYRGKPFTSVEVAAGTAGVINPESVVHKPEQVNLKYLLELS